MSRRGSAAGSPRPPGKVSLKTTLLLIGVVFTYALLQPKLEGWLGIDLPSLSEEDVAAPENAPAAEEPASDTSIDEGRSNGPMHSAPAAASEAEGAPQSRAIPENSPSTPKLGELREIGGGVFQSTAGLIYRPGSQEGHRIKHILRHHEDVPGRPVHGVFDGDRDEVFAVIDEAYLLTFDNGPPRVTSEVDDGRTIYRVDLGRRIGYVGGQQGRRDGHPAAEHVQLILDGTNVITAYPIRIRRQRR